MSSFKLDCLFLNPWKLAACYPSWRSYYMHINMLLVVHTHHCPLDPHSIPMDKSSEAITGLSYSHPLPADQICQDNFTGSEHGDSWLGYVWLTGLLTMPCDCSLYTEEMACNGACCNIITVIGKDFTSKLQLVHKKISLYSWLCKLCYYNFIQI